MFLIKTVICVKIRINSIIGYQYMTSFSFNFDAAYPKVIHVNKYLNAIILEITIHWY
jgi:hypothetical protein